VTKIQGAVRRMLRPAPTATTVAPDGVTGTTTAPRRGAGQTASARRKPACTTVG